MHFDSYYSDWHPIVLKSTRRELDKIWLMRLCQFQLFATILLSRLAVPFGDKQIQVSWIIGIFCFGVIALRTGFAFSVYRIAAVSCIASITIFESAYYHPAFSPLSLIYLFGIYIPLCLTLPSLDGDALRDIWGSFVKLSIVLAVGGLLQVVIEFLAGSYFFDPIGLLPQQYQLDNYVTIYKTSIGPLSYIKPNGIFALEPSFFSQFLALALVAELEYFRRMRVMVLLALALLASFSGTGLLILFIAVPFMKGSPKWIILIVVFGLSWSFVAGDLVGSSYSQRLQEVNKPGQSANARFVFPYEVLWERWNHSSEDMMVGIGAGQSSLRSNIYEANFAPVAKVGLEFGLIGLAAFLALWLSMYINLALPGCMIAAILVFYFVASGALLHPPTVFPIWTLTLGFMSIRRMKTMGLQC